MPDLAAKLKRLNEAARELATCSGEAELFERILDVVERVFHRNSAAVLLCDEARTHLRIRSARGYDPSVVATYHAPIGQGIAGTVAATGASRLVADVRAEPDYLPGVDAAISEMAVPLVVDGEVIGVLDVESREGPFDQTDMALLEVFGEQAAWAMRHGRALASAAEQARRLREIAKTAHRLNTVHDAEAVLAESLDGACSALGLERAALLLIDRATSELEVHAARGYGAIVGKRISMARGITGAVARTGEAILVSDVTADPRYVGGVHGGAAEMAVPLRVRGEILGVLDSESPEQGAFGPQDLELFQAFADQAAVALHNARLFRRLEEANERLRTNVEEVERLNVELEAYAKQISRANEALENQIRQLTAVHLAGQAITSSLDLGETLGAILRMSGEIVRSSSGAIKLLDEETHELRVAARAGAIVDDLEGASYRYGLPLRIGDRTIGVFELARLANEQLGDDEKKLLETLASQAAIAIENARLFEDTQRVYYATLKSLAQALEARDEYTRGHSERVADLALVLARGLGLPEERCRLVHDAALLHDIGKIGVRDDVLLAPRKLSELELSVIRQHPAYGSMILGPLKFLGEVSRIVRFHHERWDGTGYPDGLAGEAIPLEARIIAVADCYDAMTSTRPYRSARSHDDALEEIARFSGVHFDPAVAGAFVAAIGARRADGWVPGAVSEGAGPVSILRRFTEGAGG